MAVVGPSPEVGAVTQQTLPPKEKQPPERKGAPVSTSSWSAMWRRLCGGGEGGDEAALRGEEERRLRANDREFNRQFKYADNYIKTSKYNLLTFAPKNLFEQFQRIANFYFLVLMILQFIPWISSIAWYSTAIPLAIVLAFSAVKDAYDDIQRHISDRNVNGRKSYVVRDGHLAEEEWSNVKVGDVIRMMSNQFVAADLLVLSTSEPSGICFIETKELDGETNLKNRNGLQDTAEMGDDLSKISQFDGEVICEAPNNRLNTFRGQLHWQGRTLPLNNDQLLLRGCVLRNTRWCYGLVVFAGKDTKLMMNSGKTKFKRTSLDRFLNILIMGIVLFLIAMCLICTILCGVWEWTTGRGFTAYLEWDTDIVPNVYERSSKQIAVIAFLQFFSYIILLNTVVPISLYVSVEIIRFVHSMWINFDQEMFYDNGEEGIPAKAHTTTLNEELGQVQYIFSDKTGTLTRNIMAFNKCSINGISYGDVFDARGNKIVIEENTRSLDFSFNPQHEASFKFFDPRLLEETRKGNKEVTEFWRLLALCHTVMPERDKAGNLSYQAQSPDEAALTGAARNFGFVFRSRTPQSITIEVNGKEETYELLTILDFNNVRKRMSVIVRRNGAIKLYCKGADTTVLPRLKTNTSPLLIDGTKKHLDDFAETGLRTLVLAAKDIDPAYYEQWKARLHEAEVDMYNRDARMDEAFEDMEKEMLLVGATAIEDKLQEGVPETIAKLAEANIKIWVLTGDKTETAINIAYSCNLLTEQMRDIYLIECTTEKEVEVQLKHTKQLLGRARSRELGNGTTGERPRVDIAHIHGDDANGDVTYTHSDGRVDSPPLNGNGHIDSTPEPPTDEEGDGFAIVITGEALVHALSPKLERTFLEIACQCRSVICCRVTPLQKAQVVDLVRRNKKAVTLAVGDGANDVSMIKTAHIGVGISGQEGMQAVLASDYSIGQFRYLQRLLLVHGRWSYYRMAKFLRYFFYKNFAFTLTHFWYAFFCGYSAQTVYDAVLIACYNLFFTALPVLSMGSLDQDVDDNCSLKNPKLYWPGQFNLFFNMRIFIYSVLHGMASSLLIFFIPYGAIYMNMDHSGRDFNDYSVLAFTCFTALIIVVTGQIAFDTDYWTVITHVVIWGSLIFYFALVFIFYEALPVSVISKTSSAISYGVVIRSMASTQFWFSILMISVVLLLPVVLNRFFWLDTHPSFTDILRVQRKLPAPKKEEPAQRVFPRTAGTRRSMRGSLRSGYAFSHQQGFGDLILKGKLFQNVEGLRGGRSPRPSPTAGLSLIEEGSVPMVSPVPSTLPSSTRLPTGPDPAQSTRPPHQFLINVDGQTATPPGLAESPPPHLGVTITGDGRPYTRGGRITRETEV